MYFVRITLNSTHYTNVSWLIATKSIVFTKTDRITPQAQKPVIPNVIMVCSMVMYFIRINIILRMTLPMHVRAFAHQTWQRYTSIHCTGSWTMNNEQWTMENASSLVQDDNIYDNFLSCCCSLETSLFFFLLTWSKYHRIVCSAICLMFNDMVYLEKVMFHLVPSLY